MSLDRRFRMNMRSIMMLLRFSRRDNIMSNTTATAMLIISALVKRVRKLQT